MRVPPPLREKERTLTSMPGNKLQGTLDAFRELIQQQGWSIVAEKELQHGYQLLVTDGSTKVSIDCFTTGNALIQGQTGKLRNEIQDWWSERKAASKAQNGLNNTPVLLWQEAAPSETTSVPQKIGIAHIGSDESGKGDYFGPLVVAAVYVNPQTEHQLAQIKVRDSKTVPDNIILSLAEEIERICRGQGLLRRYQPERYNALYTQFGNLNLLLADAHAQVIANLQKTVASEKAIVDKFADESLIQQALLKLGCTISVEQRVRAEDDIAVAAASIMARATFIKAIQELSQRIDMHLPKGASDPRIVTIGREIVAKYGREMLGKVAKLHFRTTEAILDKEN